MKVISDFIRIYVRSYSNLNLCFHLWSFQSNMRAVCPSLRYVNKQTSDSNCHDSLMQEVNQRSRDQMWSVPHDSKGLRNPWFLPYFTWQEPSALHPHLHFKALFSCVFWVRMWISLVYVLQRLLYCWQNVAVSKNIQQTLFKQHKMNKRSWYWMFLKQAWISLLC